MKFEVGQIENGYLIYHDDKAIYAESLEHVQNYMFENILKKFIPENSSLEDSTIAIDNCKVVGLAPGKHIYLANHTGDDKLRIENTSKVASKFYISF